MSTVWLIHGSHYLPAVKLGEERGLVRLAVVSQGKIKRGWLAPRECVKPAPSLQAQINTMRQELGR